MCIGTSGSETQKFGAAANIEQYVPVGQLSVSFVDGVVVPKQYANDVSFKQANVISVLHTPQ